MTGATSGIGKVTAITLATLGANVTVFCRDMNKGNALREEFEKTKNEKQGLIHPVECDLSSFRSVKQACAEFRNNHKTLDVLINNAGIWNPNREISRDGIEETFAVNFLAPYYISREMTGLLKHDKEARIIFTASGLHQGTIHFDDIEFTTAYSGFNAYKQSKLGIILFTRFLAGELKNTGISVFSVHPGLVNTNLARNAGFIPRNVFKVMGLSPEKGAVTLIYAATAGNLSKFSGEYLYLKKVKETSPESYDMDTAKRLIELAEEYLVRISERE